MITRFEGRVLDWHPSLDPRNHNHPMRAVLPDRVEPRPRRWGHGPILDQGREGACVGFGCTAELMAEPMPWRPLTTRQAELYALRAYRRAQDVDEWQGRDYEGTSVNAGMKIMREDGHIDGWTWMQDPLDVRDAVIAKGPVPIGIFMRESMFYPRRSGLLEVHGRVVGGHCLTIIEYHPRKRLGVAEGWTNRFEVYGLQQSWGADHGRNGIVYLRADDLHQLLASDGEAALPVGRKPVRVVV